MRTSVVASAFLCAILVGVAGCNGTHSTPSSSGSRPVVHISHAACAKQVHKWETDALSLMSGVALTVGELDGGNISSATAKSINGELSKLQRYENKTPDCVPTAELTDTTKGIGLYRQAVTALENDNLSQATKLSNEADVDWNKANDILDSYGLPNYSGSSNPSTSPSSSPSATPSAKYELGFTPNVPGNAPTIGATCQPTAVNDGKIYYQVDLTQEQNLATSPFNLSSIQVSFSENGVQDGFGDYNDGTTIGVGDTVTIYGWNYFQPLSTSPGSTIDCVVRQVNS